MKYFFSLLFLSLLLVFTPHKSEAQNNSFAKQKSYISIGYGFPSIYGKNLNLWNTFMQNILSLSISKSIINPICINYDKALSQKISVGAGFSFSQLKFDSRNFISSNSNAFGNLSYKNNMMAFTLRGAYHPFANTLKRLDPYVGVETGYNYNNIDTVDVHHTLSQQLRISSAPSLVYNAFVGAKYFYKKVGVYSEIGYSNIQYFKVGFVFRFGPDWID